MNTTANQTTETPTLLEGIILTIYNQIAEFQADINGREAGKRYPEIAEVTWLTKMIACADKLVKQNAPERHDKSIKAFIKYAGADEPNLDKAMIAAYRNYISEIRTTPPKASSVPEGPSAPEAPSAPAPFPAPQNAPALFPAPQTGPFPAPQTAPAPLPALSHAPMPVTEADFNNYKHLLDRDQLNHPKEHAIEFNGTQRNLKWLQYNLLQYCKPITSRRYHFVEATFQESINHENVSAEIDRMIGEGKIRLVR